MKLNLLVLKKCTLYIAGTDGSLAHGPNSVISMIHYAFQTYGLREIDCSLHADNCGGIMNQIYIFIFYYYCHFDLKCFTISNSKCLKKHQTKNSNVSVY